MARPKSQIAYVLKYKKANITKVSVEFNKNMQRDMTILEFLRTKPSKQAYIKELIEKDMQNK